MAGGGARAEEGDAGAACELVEGEVLGKGGGGHAGDGLAGAARGAFAGRGDGRAAVRAAGGAAEGADVGEAEVADGLVARDARHEDLARDKDEVRADGERQLLPPVEDRAHRAAQQRERAAATLGEACEDRAHAQAGDASAAVRRIDGDAAAAFVVDGQDGGDGGIGRERQRGRRSGRRSGCAPDRRGSEAGGGRLLAERHGGALDGDGFDFVFVHGDPPLCKIQIDFVYDCIIFAYR